MSANPSETAPEHGFVALPTQPASIEAWFVVVEPNTKSPRYIALFGNAIPIGNPNGIANCARQVETLGEC
jgi:hypothetical protein